MVVWVVVVEGLEHSKRTVLAVAVLIAGHTLSAQLARLLFAGRLTLDDRVGMIGITVHLAIVVVIGPRVADCTHAIRAF